MMKPVCIVGAGPTGLVAALALHWHGIPVVVIDKTAAHSTLSKALVIHARTLELLEILGVAAPLLAKGKPIDRLEFCLDTHHIEISLNSLATPYPYVLSIPQSDTEQLLEEECLKRGIRIERGEEVTSLHQEKERLVIGLSGGEEIDCDWLIAADGAHSFVRHTLGMTFSGVTRQEHFLVADVKIQQQPSRDRLYFFFTPEGQTGAIPFGEELFRILIPDVIFNTAGEPTLEEVNRLFNQRTGKSWQFHDPQWLAYFTINSRQIAHYRLGRIFFAGDSAHVHSPVGGQGMNTGMHDSINLAWKLAFVIKGVSPEEILDSYEEERWPVGHTLVAATDALTRLITSKATLLRWAREKLMPAALSTPFLQRLIARKISEIDIHYRDSSLVEHVGGFLSTGPHAGDSVPSRGPFYQLLKNKKQLLLFFTGLASDEEITELTQELQQRIAPYQEHMELILIVPRAYQKEGIRVIVDEENKLQEEWHTSYQMGLWLLRLDAYVGFSSKPLDLEALSSYLVRLFKPSSEQRDLKTLS